MTHIDKALLLQVRSAAALHGEPLYVAIDKIVRSGLPQYQIAAATTLDEAIAPLK